MRAEVCRWICGVVLVVGSQVSLCAEIEIRAERNDAETAGAGFRFASVPVPARNDAATGATFRLLHGRRDRNGGQLEQLNDGRLPSHSDDPAANFFFVAGTDGGRLLVELPEVIEVQQVNTYSWHPGTRGPQVYRLYVSDGAGDGFSVDLGGGEDPAEKGWGLLADVSTREKDAVVGGQYGVSVGRTEGPLGRYRYLLFDISRTEDRDPFGNTFYSEIDVVQAGATVAPATPASGEGGKVIEVEAGEHHLTLDTSETPDLSEWVERELAPVVREWYPRLAELLPSEGYEAPARVRIVFSKDMRGVAATSGTRVRVAANWFRSNLNGEAKGSIVHELVHVIQQYGRARSNPNRTRNPGWLVEGLADYIRWYLYEPESRGAQISRRGLERARYDASYRVTANFLNWVVTQHGEELIPKLNAAMREGRYEEEFWKSETGKTVDELGEEWRKELEEKLGREED